MASPPIQKLPKPIPAPENTPIQTPKTPDLPKISDCEKCGLVRILEDKVGPYLKAKDVGES
jgi:hypothetical protein